MATDPHSLIVARNLRGFARSEIPAEAFDRAKAAIVDTLGVTLAGSVHDACAKLRTVVAMTAQAGPASVIGRDGRLNVLDAALLNGLSGHMLDFDDSNSHMFGHVSVAVLPALLALAEREHASGLDVLRAFVCGFETGARFGNALSKYQYTHGWHPTTSVGIFAAVGAGAVLLDLDEHEIAMAIGIAAHMASGIKSNFGSMTKPLGVGHASRNALMALLLAREGFTSGPRVFEHHQGLFAVFNNGAAHVDADALLAPWTSDIRILDRKKGIKQKQFPCCYACAPPLDGVLELRASAGLRPADIAAIDIAVHPIRFPHINVPDPVDALAAKFSVHYCAARAIATGGVVMSDFEDGPAFSDEATRSVMRRVTLRTYDRDNPSGAEVTIRTTEGRELRTVVEAALGSTYDHPLTDEMLRAKFLDCAARAIPPDQALRLHEALQEIARCPDITTLTDQMRAPPALATAAE